MHSGCVWGRRWERLMWLAVGELTFPLSLVTYDKRFFGGRVGFFLIIGYLLFAFFRGPG